MIMQTLAAHTHINATVRGPGIHTALPALLKHIKMVQTTDCTVLAGVFSYAYATKLVCSLAVWIN